MTARAFLGLGTATALLLVASGCAAERQPQAEGGPSGVGGKGPVRSAAQDQPGSTSSNATAPASANAAASAQNIVTATAHPLAGSAQRAAIMNALRPTIERKLGSPVEFVVNRVSVEDGWALVIADPQRPGGGRINPRRHFPHEVIEFMDGLTINAILRFGGGGWTLVDHAIGPTDVWYCGVEGPPKSLTGC
jgi:hypothetical protein